MSTSIKNSTSIKITLYVAETKQYNFMQDTFGKLIQKPFVKTFYSNELRRWNCVTYVVIPHNYVLKYIILLIMNNKQAHRLLKNCIKDFLNHVKMLIGVKNHYQSLVKYFIELCRIRTNFKLT